MNKDLTLRLLSPADAKAVAQIHIAGFEHFFLSSFGTTFLTVFYASIFRHANGYGVGLFEDENKLIGFSVGCQPSAGFYLSLFVNNIFRLGWVMLPTILKSPSKLLRILKAFKSSGKKTVENENSATLLSICVRQNIKGKGIGKQLLDGFEEETRKRGADEVILTTRTDDNAAVNHFYLRNDYQLLETFVKYESQKENFYSKKIKS